MNMQVMKGLKYVTIRLFFVKSRCKGGHGCTYILPRNEVVHVAFLGGDAGNCCNVCLRFRKKNPNYDYTFDSGL